MRYLHRKFSQLPAQAIPAKCGGILLRNFGHDPSIKLPRGARWPQEAIDEFSRLVRPTTTGMCTFLTNFHVSRNVKIRGEKILFALFCIAQ